MTNSMELRTSLPERSGPAEASPSIGALAAQAAPLDLSLVIPTLNEVLNIAELLQRLGKALAGLNWEAVFVDDDSADRTADFVRQVALTHPNIRIIQRIGRRGLSTACIEGMLATSAPYIAVMDADLQHDEGALPRMLEMLREGAIDIVVGSRYAEDLGDSAWGDNRTPVHRLAERLGRIALHADLHDPMSGFFMIRREAFMAGVHRLSSGGVKILFDLFGSAPAPLRHAEIPYACRERYAGTTKLDSQLVWDYLMLVIDKLIGHIVPIRFIIFCMVGVLGLLVHFAALSVFYKVLGMAFATAQAGAALVAMTSNFLFNNYITFRDQRLQGWRGLAKGWATFALSCSIGTFANVGIADYLHDRDGQWVSSAIAGVLVGAVFNYALSSVFTWRKTRRG